MSTKSGTLQTVRVSFERIVVDHEIMGGVPCIRGTRMPVTRLLKMVAAGMSVEEIRAAFPQVTAEDVHEALLYAAAAVAERVLPLRHTA
ncbi:MAG: DUF433 domain-containing protein [Pseudonocardia sp.]